MSMFKKQITLREKLTVHLKIMNSNVWELSVVWRVLEEFNRSLRVEFHEL